MRIVISQSMYFPWVGFLEQLRHAETFVIYDDVQFSKGGFTNRVQIKTATGSQWLTVPLSGLHLGQRIDVVQTNEARNWRIQHLERLDQAYRKAPFKNEMLTLVERVFAKGGSSLSEIAHSSTMELSEYFGLKSRLRILNAASLNISGSGSQRVLDVVTTLGGTVYITGHGARNYLNHTAFERAGVEVRYMQYRCEAYSQLHGEFTPYVSALDLVANCGPQGARYIQSETVPWVEFINESA